MLNQRIALLLLACGCQASPSDWVPAYERGIAELEARYAFTEHKQLDWAAIDLQIRPRIEAAAAAGDGLALDQALRELVAVIPDNHIELDAADCAHTERGFGLVLTDTDDAGVVVARVVDPTLGLEPGERVVSWNGVPIEDARLSAPTECLHEGIATLERQAFEQLRYLVRGAVGETAMLATDRGEYVLSANDEDADAFEAFETSFACARVICQHIDGDIGVVSLDSTDGDKTLGRMRRAIQDFIDAGVTGVVLDLRGNSGGSDDRAARLAGFFHRETVFYQYESLRDGSGEFAIDLTYQVEPQSVVWTGPVAVLIDGFTVSSGEGVAMAVGRRDNALVVGFEGTAASFGFTGPSVSIGGREIYYPDGQSWDAAEQVQLDSDESLRGGVQPEHRIAWTFENRRDYASGVDIVFNEAVALLRSTTD